MVQRSNLHPHITKALVLGVFVFLCFFLVVILEQQAKVINTPTKEISENKIEERPSPFSRSFYSSTSSKSYININNNFYNLFLARSSEERAKGLSGREGLQENEGMFFVFPKEGRHGFWMKDMSFPVDALWLNKEAEVIYIVENMKPESFPKTYYPDIPATFVVELPINTVAKTKVKVGDKIEGDVFGYAEMK
jgi:uncharacterized membrane protein (UPF0127 family)